MKKVLNRPENVGAEMLQGLAVLSPGIVRLPGHKVMYRADAVQVRDQQVAIISGGGSGHEPGHAGYEALQIEYQKGIAYGYHMGLRPQTLYGIADSPVGLAAYFLDHDARSYELIARVFAGGSEGPYSRRRSGQHHAHLVDEYGALRGSSLLGKQGLFVLRHQRRRRSDRRERLSRRTLSCSTKLGGTGVPQAHSLQQAPQGRALCGLGTAEALCRRGSRGLPNIAQLVGRMMAGCERLPLETSGSAGGRSHSTHPIFDLPERSEGKNAVNPKCGTINPSPSKRRCAMPDPSQFNIDRTYRGRWTITFSNPPINMFAPSTILELGALMTDLEADPSVKVVVFQSANPDFFIAHLDVAKAAERRERWAFGATLCCVFVHASREHRQDSRPHARHR